MKHVIRYGQILLLMLLSSPIVALEITTNEVYAQVYHINEEIKLLNQHFNIQGEVEVFELKTKLAPRHTWQKTYEVTYKINILREKLGLPVFAAPSIEPRRKIIPLYIYEQTQRILVELHIIKLFLGIEERASNLPTFSGKAPTDVFNLFNNISYQLDLLNGISFTPSHVFSQAIRILDDINILLSTLEIIDSTIPPPKQKGMKPSNVFETALELLKEVQRLQRFSNIKDIGIHGLKPDKKITPSEVFSLLGTILAELQTVKAYLHLTWSLTPIAKHYENKSPNDVQQVLGWALRRVKLINTLNR